MNGSRGQKRTGLLVAALLFAGAAHTAFTSIQRVAITATCSIPLPDTPVIPLFLYPQIAVANQPVDILGQAFYDAGVQEVTLFYKKTYDVLESSQTQVFSPPESAASFVFTIPAEFVTSEGILFRVEIRGVGGAFTREPSTGYHFIEVTGFSQAMIGPEGGSVVIDDANPGDGQTVLDIPAGALDQPTLITMEQMDGSSAGAPAIGPAAAVSFPAFGTRTSGTPAAVFRLEPSGLRFKRPATLRIRYRDLDQDGRLDSDGEDERRVQIFAQTPSGGWSGVGGAVDTSKNEVRARIMHFSTYGAFPALALAPKDYRPVQKVFTPGSADGINDTLDFNGALSLEDKVDIFDTQGGRVKALSYPFQWDGRDESGRLVESGLYIYQYTKDGETVSGVFAVAK
jgi:hypothetical protein